MLNNILLKNDQVEGYIKSEIKTYIETNENNNIAYLNFWDAAKAVITGNVLAL